MKGKPYLDNNFQNSKEIRDQPHGSRVPGAAKFRKAATEEREDQKRPVKGL
jgi:hypothetical protein